MFAPPRSCWAGAMMNSPSVTDTGAVLDAESYGHPTYNQPSESNLS